MTPFIHGMRVLYQGQIYHFDRYHGDSYLRAVISFGGSTLIVPSYELRLASFNEISDKPPTT